MLEGLGGVAGDRDVRPGVVADLHPRADPDAQNLLGVGIVLQLDGVHKTVGPFEMVSLEFSGQRRGDLAAVRARRQAACGGQVVEGERLTGPAHSKVKPQSRLE